MDPAPTPPPFTQVSSPPTPPKVCPEEEDSFQVCFQWQMSADEVLDCVDCVDARIPEYGTDCDEVNKEVCKAFSSCEEYCGSCQTELERFISCVVESSSERCTLTCGEDDMVVNAPPPTSPPYPEPTIIPDGTNDCTAKLESARSCLDVELNADDLNACKNCINDGIPQAGDSCEVVEANMCAKFGICSCGACQEKVIDYYTCAFSVQSGCPMECSAIASPSEAPVASPPNGNPVEQPIPSPPSLNPVNLPTVAPTNQPVQSLCSSEMDLAYQCLDTQMDLASSESCKSCFNKGVPLSFESCADTESAMCSSFKSCPCGACREVVVRYFSCAYGETNQCLLDCDGALNPHEDDAGTDVPEDDPCQVQRDAYELCLTIVLSPAMSENCQSCGSTVLPQDGNIGTTTTGLSELDCENLNSGVCSTLTDCDCDGCVAAAVDLVSCEIGALNPDIQCSLRCDGGDGDDEGEGDNRSSSGDIGTRNFSGGSIVAVIASALLLLAANN